ncbi:MAG: hypothetical protein J5685_10790, partial [Clostridiales bacterium]|nr:hypothetical protein [Clostridiales bacterium]
MKKRDNNKIRTPGVPEPSAAIDQTDQSMPGSMTADASSDISPDAAALPGGASFESGNSAVTEGSLDASIPSEVSVSVTEEAGKAHSAATHVNEKTVLSDLESIDPDFLTGEQTSAVSSVSGKTGRRLRRAVKESRRYEKNRTPRVEMDLSGKGSGKRPETADISSKATRKAAMFTAFGVFVLLLVASLSIFFGAGLKDRLKSPLKIHGQFVDSAEFSFMYHYLLIDNGVDIFASGTQEMLNGPYESPDYATTRDYFLDLTAKEMQTTMILYDDATAHGYEIGPEHYAQARAYIDWLSGKAMTLGVPLDIYIRGVFGDQVTEQIALNTLAKKFFTEDYASGAKLVELQATEEQAEEAYQNNRNAYDLVNYKLIRITYERRDEAFINTANLHAQEIIAATNGDPANFEPAAAEYFTGEARNRLLTENSALERNVRYQDITHPEFRDWLFDASRQRGDTVIFPDSDGFPIILCFVSRERQSVPLRDVRIVHVNTQSEEGGTGLPVADAQLLTQEIYELLTSGQADIPSIENLYTNFVIDGSLEIIHSQDTYPG